MHEKVSVLARRKVEGIPVSVGGCNSLENKAFSENLWSDGDSWVGGSKKANENQEGN